MAPSDTETDPQRDEEELSVVERAVLHAATAGRLIDLRVGDPGLDDPAQGAGWGVDRTVRAGVLVELLTGARAREGGRLRPVRLSGARITGTLDLEAADLGCSLLLSGCRFEQVVNLCETTVPALGLPGCHVPGLVADQLRTTGNLDLDGITAQGELSLVGAHIGGRLSLAGARLSPANGRALNAENLSLGHDLRCGDRFTAVGEIRLAGARVGGVVDLDGGHLSNPAGLALDAEGLVTERSMSCRQAQGRSFTAEGEVRLAGARIAGSLCLNRAQLTNPGGRALSAPRLTVEGDLQCDQGFTARGQVNLVGARIGGLLDLDAARLTSPDTVALSAAGLTIAGAMLCRHGFTADGELNLMGAHIGGALDMNDAALNNPGGVALRLEATHATAVFLRPRRRTQGAVDLTNAHVTNFGDDQATWPAIVRLQGFTYQTLEDTEVDVRGRLRWLTRHPSDYAPQIYDQLATTYRRSGHEQAARQVAIAKQRRRRTVLNPAGKLGNWLLFLTVGYGYRTWLAAVWLAGLLALGTAVFGQAHPGHMTRTDPNGPAFHALAYTLDLVLPIADLGQQKAWRPEGTAMYWSWALMAAGWILATVVVAGLTAILKRE